MSWLYGVLVIVISAVLLYVAGEMIVRALGKISRYFKVTEFFVAFFVMAFAASLPNVFVGVTSALKGIPELSFGDIMGNNLIALTVAVALGVLFSPRRELPLENQTIQDTSFLTAVAAVLPLILVSDGFISRSDGLVLLLFFFGYVYWMLNKRERFTRVFEEELDTISRRDTFREIGFLFAGVTLLAVAAQGVVYGADIIASGLGLSLLFVGMFVIAFGGALPEIYFTIISARRDQTGLIIGNLMGAVIIPATFVLGLVAMIHPIHNEALEFSFVGRVFLVLVAVFFLVMSQTKHIITTREASVLLASYFAFVLVSIFFS